MILFFAAALSAASLFARKSFFDDYVCRAWTSFGSLTGTTATDIIQTSDGYINIGTYEGLVRFDGVDFSILRKSRKNTFTFASARTIFEDSDGNLWVGSNDEGVQRISPNEEKKNLTFTTANGLPNNSVRAFAEDHHKNIWVGTADGIAMISPDGKISIPKIEKGSAASGIIAIQLYCDTAGRIWLVTNGRNGIFVYMDGAFRSLSELEQFEPYSVTSVGQDLNGNFWLALAEKGIVRLNNGKAKRIESGTKIDRIPTKAIFAEKNGTLWFGTEQGIAAYTEGKFYDYTAENPLATATVNRILGDREGCVWFATDRNGIIKMNHGKFVSEKTDCTVNAIAQDKEGLIWLGTDKGLLCKTDDGENIENDLTRHLDGIRIRHVGSAKNGDILVCCYKKPGIVRWSKRSGEIKSWSRDDGISGDKTRVVIEDRGGNLWAGTTTGLSVIRPDGKISNYGKEAGMDNEYVMCIYEDKKGLIWVGTDGGGVYIFKDGKIIEKLTSTTGLAGNVIFKICQDPSDGYWICTGNGISKYDSFEAGKGQAYNCSNLTADMGLGTDSIFQVIFDGTGHIWMTSNHGIASTSFFSMNAAAAGTIDKAEVKFYNTNDGLSDNGVTSTSLSLCDKYGRLWFTLTDGYSVYDPVKTKENPVSPLVRIEKVIIDDTEQKDLSVPLILKAGTKRIVISYTGLSFASPERLLFMHKLSGFEENFTSPASGRAVSYTNLKPGKYTFLLNAVNDEGLASESPAELTLIQEPFFYQMISFWIFVAVIVIGAIFLIFRVRMRVIQLENIRLEGLVKERTASLEKEKEKSDGLLKAILPVKIADRLKESGVKTIGENFQSASILFTDIVNFTTISSGHTAKEIVTSLNDLFSRFDERAKNLGIEKIKTIGDSYMAACGIPEKKENHAAIMLDFARGIYIDLAEYNRTASIPFKIRVGINCGPVVAGIIGTTKFIYDVWGNTVNVASRMESVCTPGAIRVTQAVKNETETHKVKNVTFSAPIECDIKGKGKMTTYEVINN